MGDRLRGAISSIGNMWNRIRSSFGNGGLSLWRVTGLGVVAVGVTVVAGCSFFPESCPDFLVVLVTILWDVFSSGTTTAGIISVLSVVLILLATIFVLQCLILLISLSADSESKQPTREQMAKMLHALRATQMMALSDRVLRGLDVLDDLTRQDEKQVEEYKRSRRWMHIGPVDEWEQLPDATQEFLNEMEDNLSAHEDELPASSPLTSQLEQAREAIADLRERPTEDRWERVRSELESTIRLMRGETKPNDVE